MIVTEPIAMIGLNKDPGRLRAYDDRGMNSLKRLAPGRGRHEVGRNDAAIGVSALPDDLSWTVPHVLSTADVERVIEQWAIACRRLREAGFSGVELSAGHGHLFHQFLSPWSNRRDDGYGGDVKGRTRFLRELISAIRTECGRPFIIGTNRQSRGRRDCCADCGNGRSRFLDLCMGRACEFVVDTSARCA
jgi:hypothetical protein